MPEILRMPEVAANTPEAVLANWNVELNKPYAAGDAIVTVETEKAVVDVEAESDGVLLRMLVDAGAQVDVGAPIAVWGTEDETTADVDALLSSLGVDTGDAPPVEEVAGADEPEAESSVAAEEVEPAALPSASDDAPSAETRSAEARSAEAPSAEAPSGKNRTNGERIFASPLARKIARESGLDLDQVVGSGPRGRIRRSDVDAALANGTPPPAPTGPTTTAAPAADAGAQSTFEDVPNTRLRQAIARRLTESKQTAPHFYVRGSARVDKLLALRREINDGGVVKVSVNDLIVKAVARAHALEPGLNVQWNDDSIRHFSGVDIAVAVATEGGLVTPVIRGVDDMTIQRLVEATQDLIGRAKDRRLQQHELEGGSISITNLGMYGTEEFAAIINPPQAAILAVGAAREEAVVENGELAVGTVLRVTLAVDHRPVDGATAAEWMRTFVGLLEHPAQILI